MRPVRLSLFALGILLIVVALGAPRALFSIGELCGGAILIGIGLLVRPRKRGVALKDLPWIKAAKSDRDSDSNAGA